MIRFYFLVCISFGLSSFVFLIPERNLLPQEFFLCITFDECHVESVVAFAWHYFLILDQREVRIVF